MMDSNEDLADVLKAEQQEIERVSAELKRLYKFLGHVPSKEEFRKHGRFSLQKVNKTFKNRHWDNILRTVFVSNVKGLKRKTNNSDLKKTNRNYNTIIKSRFIVECWSENEDKLFYILCNELVRKEARNLADIYIRKKYKKQILIKRIVSEKYEKTLFSEYFEKYRNSVGIDITNINISNF